MGNGLAERACFLQHRVIAHSPRIARHVLLVLLEHNRIILRLHLLPRNNAIQPFPQLPISPYTLSDIAIKHILGDVSGEPEHESPVHGGTQHVLLIVLQHLAQRRELPRGRASRPVPLEQTHQRWRTHTLPQHLFVSAVHTTHNSYGSPHNAWKMHKPTFHKSAFIPRITFPANKYSGGVFSSVVYYSSHFPPTRT